ncbi:MAG: VWA domain-containing protein, partial [Gammaproteobacteria bacterium]|nr:VWA domain-containing protein [Gammaproteobacteria bacterium]
MFEALFKYSLEDYARSELVYLGDWPAWSLYGLVIVATGAIAALLYRRRRDAHWYQLAAIGSLQLAMLGVVIWALLQPTLATDRLREGENAIAMVVDASESMLHGDGRIRFDVALSALSDVILGDDAPDMTARYYEMGSSARPVDSFIDSTPSFTTTSIADSLTAVLEEARYSPVAAIILSSDGADTGGGLSADDLAELAGYGVPIHTIGVGRASMPEDLELTDVTLPDRALPGSTVSARISVRHDA